MPRVLRATGRRRCGRSSKMPSGNGGPASTWRINFSGSRCFQHVGNVGGWWEGGDFERKVDTNPRNFSGSHFAIVVVCVRKRRSAPVQSEVRSALRLWGAASCLVAAALFPFCSFPHWLCGFPLPAPWCLVGIPTRNQQSQNRNLPFL